MTNPAHPELRQALENLARGFSTCPLRPLYTTHTAEQMDLWWMKRNAENAAWVVRVARSALASLDAVLQQHSPQQGQEQQAQSANDYLDNRKNPIMLPKQHSADWISAIEHAVSRIEATLIAEGESPEQLRAAIALRVAGIAAPTFVVPTPPAQEQAGQMVSPAGLTRWTVDPNGRLCKSQRGGLVRYEEVRELLESASPVQEGAAPKGEAADTQRLDWLQQFNALHIDYYVQNGARHYILRDCAWGRPLGNGPTVRAAIDAAMGATPIAPPAAHPAPDDGQARTRHCAASSSTGREEAMSKSKKAKPVAGEHYKMIVNAFHDNIVAMQAAWIEWQHGEGAEAAMSWIHNTLAGPGHLPDVDAEFGKEPQAFFDANRAEPLPRCQCGRPSNIGWMGKGFCCEQHYADAKAKSLN